MDSWHLLIEVVALLAGCLLAGAVLSRLHQSPLVGYLLAGMLMGGPGSLNIVGSESHIEAIAELGVSLLLFSLGLEFSWQRLKGLGSRTLAAGAAQVVLTAIGATGAAFLFGVDTQAAIVIGAMIALSSTAAVLRVLVDRGEIESVHGRNSLAVLLVQDMAVVPLTLLLSMLSEQGGPTDVAINVARVLGLAVLLIAGLYLLLNFVAVRLLLALSAERNRELTVLLAVVVGLGSTWAAHAAGLSPALGAFIAGMFLGGSPFATQIRADVSSLRVVLLTLFFGAVGMVADPIWMLEHLGTVLALAALILLGKALLVWLIFQCSGQTLGVAVATGICVAQVGEFSFVLGSIGKNSGILTETQFTLLVSSAIATLFATPYLVQFAPHAGYLIARLLRRTAVRPASNNHPTHPEIVIIGFGPAGQAVARDLLGSSRRILVIDLNHEQKAAAEALGLHAHIGDATQAEVLEHAELRDARLIVITLPSRSAAVTVLQHARHLAPHAHVVVRSRYQLHQSDFRRAGAHTVIGDEEQVGRSLAAYVHDHIGSWPAVEETEQPPKTEPT